MSVRSWIRKVFARTPRIPHKGPARRPVLEGLEDRCLLSLCQPGSWSPTGEEPGGGEPAQLGVDEREQLGGCLAVAGGDGVEDLGDFAHATRGRKDSGERRSTCCGEFTTPRGARTPPFFLRRLGDFVAVLYGRPACRPFSRVSARQDRR